jgi:TRAP-type C4-dicarboxylate transport system substrate-binding protein
MQRRDFLFGSAAGGLALATGVARAQEVTTLRFHSIVSRDSSLTAHVVEPWMNRIEQATGGR